MHKCKENHGKKIAVIENEFGAVGVDDQLFLDQKALDGQEPIITVMNGFLTASIPFKFTDASVSTLCLKVNDLPDGTDLTIIVGTSIEDLAIEDLHKMIMVCGPKTDLQIRLSYDQFTKKFSGSHQ